MESFKHKRTEGPATVLAIGIAVLPAAHLQSQYADFYFNVTNSNEVTVLKYIQVSPICKNSGINKRRFHCTQGILKANSSLCTYKDASLNVRHDIAIKEVPRLAPRQQRKLQRSGIELETRLLTLCLPPAVVSTYNFENSRFEPLVKRSMFYQQGCLGGAMVLHVATDLAENNEGA
ncbi:unnamed protein product [Calypogeia fissa]